ncbi:MAG TPA: hypothetical protein VMZ25_02230 [Terriglobales bacterium]|nr:hypothetical protein [Terriglobales bacterium]
MAAKPQYPQNPPDQGPSPRKVTEPDAAKLAEYMRLVEQARMRT